MVGLLIGETMVKRPVTKAKREEVLLDVSSIQVVKELPSKTANSKWAIFMEAVKTTLSQADVKYVRLGTFSRKAYSNFIKAAKEHGITLHVRQSKNPGECDLYASLPENPFTQIGETK